MKLLTIIITCLIVSGTALYGIHTWKEIELKKMQRRDFSFERTDDYMQTFDKKTGELNLLFFRNKKSPPRHIRWNSYLDEGPIEVWEKLEDEPSNNTKADTSKK